MGKGNNTLAHIIWGCWESNLDLELSINYFTLLLVFLSLIGQTESANLSFDSSSGNSFSIF